jgi:hypothetical protein
MLGMTLGAAQQATSFYNFPLPQYSSESSRKISTSLRELITTIEGDFHCSLLILLPQTPLLSMASVVSSIWI